MTNSHDTGAETMSITTTDAAEAYEAGVRGFDKWSKIDGTSRVIPSLHHTAYWQMRGTISEFRAGWADAKECAATR